jgi:hypothetical protein
MIPATKIPTMTRLAATEFRAHQAIKLFMLTLVLTANGADFHAIHRCRDG